MDNVNAPGSQAARCIYVIHTNGLQLERLFKTSTAGLVYVTVFQTRREMAKFLSQISWESEVWVSEAVDHLIHFNGERFLRPYA